MHRKALALCIALVAIAPQAFAGDGAGFLTGSCEYPKDKPLPGSGTVRRVPEQHATIQAAVDAAAEGDTILVGPGIYNEEVKVSTPGLRIRGTDRNAVILDGGSTRLIGIDVTDADRVVIENMTAHNYLQHGFFWTGVTGYWGRYLTAYNNGLYGVYAYDSRCGQIDRSFGSGNADSAFYIGECYPCDAVITNIEATQNALGYSGTNAGGNLILRDSWWHDNAMGIVPNSLDGEERPPQRGATLKNNVIENNNRIDAPGVGIAGTFYGVGIAIAGGNANSVYGNTVTDHALAGIVLTPLPDQNLWVAGGNTIWGNTVTHDAEEYPESFDLGQGASSSTNNCWADNEFGNSAPDQIESIWSCAFPTTPPGGDPRVELGLITGAAGMNGRAPSPWQDWPAPGAQPTQPSDNGTGAFDDDFAVDAWLPALGLGA